MTRLQSFHSPTALWRYCGGLIEGSWLTAVIAVPLLYNPQARDGFEPFKEAFLRLFALVIVAAMAVRTIETSSLGKWWNDLKRDRLRLACATGFMLCIVSVIVSCVFSVFPRQSFWGSPQMRQGGLTELCWLIIFGAVASDLRSEAQIRRLVTAILVPTIPISLHAIMQRFGLDPLPLHEPAGGRSFGLEGNPIYLASYLGMAFPFTVLRFSEFMRWKEGSILLKVFGRVFYSLVGGIQIAAFLFAESRGPLLGLLAGLVFFAVVHAAMSSRRQLAGIMAVALLVVGFLVILGMPSGPLAPLVRLPGLTRLSGALPGAVPVEEGRISFWNQAVGFLTPSKAFRYPSDGADRWRLLRLFIGYGQETLQCVLPQRFESGNITQRLVSSFHNQFWDRWYGYGVFGTLVFFGMIALLFGMTYRRLGLIRSQGDWGRFWVMVVLSVAGLCGALVAFYGRGFFGLGAMCGLPLGLTSYAAVRGLVPVRSEPVRCPPSSREAFLISTLAVLVVHLVNTGFAFAVAAPALLFWVCMGIAMGTQDVTPADSKAEKCDQMRGILGGAVGAALAAVLVAFAFVCVFSFDPTPVAGVLYRSITRIRFDGAPSHLLSIVLIPSWIGIAFAFSLDHAWRSRDLGWVGVCLSCAIALAAAGFTGAYLKAAQIGAVGHLSEKLEYDGAALVQGRRYEAICIGLMAAILLLMAAWGFCCVPSRPVARQRATRNELRAGVVAIAFTLALCWVVCTNLIRADALAGWANALGDGGELPMAVATYKSAIEIDPHSSTYRFDLADMLIKSAEASDSPAVFANDMETAEAVLKAGRGISRLDQGGFILGSVYLRWAAGETRPSRRSSLAQKARQSFLEDLEFEPWSEVALVDLAAADDMYLGDVSEAADALKRANALIPDRESNEWFDFYAQLSLASRYPEIRRFYARRAFWCRDEALQYAGRQRQSVFSLRLRGAMLHYRFGELAPALDECRLAANDEHNADEWQAEALLAAIFNELGNRVSAAEHVRKAIQEAPEEKRASLDALRARLNAS